MSVTLATDSTAPLRSTFTCTRAGRGSAGLLTRQPPPAGSTVCRHAGLGPSATRIQTAGQDRAAAARRSEEAPFFGTQLARHGPRERGPLLNKRLPTHQVHLRGDGGVEQEAVVTGQRGVFKGGERRGHVGGWVTARPSPERPACGAKLLPALGLADSLAPGAGRQAQPSMRARCSPPRTCGHPPVTVHCRPRACTSFTRRNPACTSYMRILRSCWKAAAGRGQGGAKTGQTGVVRGASAGVRRAYRRS